PFETTPHYSGTLIGTGDTKGFFVSLQDKDFTWKHRKWQRYFALTKEGRADLPGSRLSLILAHSSGVIGTRKPFLLEYNFQVHYRDSPIENLQPTYHLTDGGKSDNLGLIPLLERSVDTIIVSQMGKEGEELGDYAQSA